MHVMMSASGYIHNTIIYGCTAHMLPVILNYMPTFSMELYIIAISNYTIVEQ